MDIKDLLKLGVSIIDSVTGRAIKFTTKSGDYYLYNNSNNIFNRRTTCGRYESAIQVNHKCIKEHFFIEKR